MAQSHHSDKDKTFFETTFITDMVLYAVQFGTLTFCLLHYVPVTNEVKQKKQKTRCYKGKTSDSFVTSTHRKSHFPDLSYPNVLNRIYSEYYRSRVSQSCSRKVYAVENKLIIPFRIQHAQNLMYLEIIHQVYSKQIISMTICSLYIGF